MIKPRKSPLTIATERNAILDICARTPKTRREIAKLLNMEEFAIGNHFVFMLKHNPPLISVVEKKLNENRKYESSYLSQNIEAYKPVIEPQKELVAAKPAQNSDFFTIKNGNSTIYHLTDYVKPVRHRFSSPRNYVGISTVYNG